MFCHGILSCVSTAFEDAFLFFRKNRFGVFDGLGLRRRVDFFGSEYVEKSRFGVGFFRKASANVKRLHRVAYERECGGRHPTCFFGGYGFRNYGNRVFFHSVIIALIESKHKGNKKDVEFDRSLRSRGVRVK